MERDDIYETERRAEQWKLFTIAFRHASSFLPAIFTMRAEGGQIEKKE
jgi:hypothetical protein